jgi:signal transduction histidine kinase
MKWSGAAGMRRNLEMPGAQGEQASGKGLLRGFLRILVLMIAGFQGEAWSQSSDLFTEQELAWIAAHPVLTIGIDPEWRPIEYMGDGVYRGLSAEYMKAVARVSGLEFRLAPPVGWASATEALLEGRVDLLPAVSEWLAPPKLRQRIAYSEPYFVGSTLIVTQASSPVIFDPRQLSGKRVAVKGGGSYEQSLRASYPDIDLVVVDSPAQALEQVAIGHAYAAVDIEAALIPILQKRYFDTLHVAGSLPDMLAVVRIGTRIGDQLLISIIDKSLASLTAKETDLMLAQWVSTTNYKLPSWSTMLHYYVWELALAVILLLAFVFLLLRAYRARRRAERSERDKAMFLAVMSHEIRTPMNAVLSSVELLGRSKLSPDDALLAKVAVTSANSLLGLLDDVLDFSKLEADKLELRCLPTDLQALIQDALSIVESRAQEKRLRLSMSVRLDSPLWLVIDAQRVRQVLINLLSNAIKFTEAGLVSVEAEVTVDPLICGTGRLRLVVSDTGMGITRRQQLRLFQAFSQVDESVTRKFGGSGLGLTICASLLKLMGGSIRLESQFGRGTQVEVLLSAPLVPPLNNPMHEGHTAPLSTGERRALSVLVVEDHPENQFVIKRQLQALGHCVTQAETGELGLSLHARSTFDIILLDCNLPDIDGYAFAARVRRREVETLERVPIIAISALVGPEHMSVCFEAGMDGVLAKPLRIDQLGQIIDLWCDVTPLATVDADEPPGVEVDLQQAFIATSSMDLGYMFQALGASDWFQVARLAHRISGAAMMLGVTDVAAAAQEVEYLAAEAGDAQGIAAAIERLRATVDSLSCFDIG